jgi:dolichol-phosphate mannosyltransferase
MQIEHKPLLSIVSPCFNERENIDELYQRITAAVASESAYRFEFLFIDNHSTDGTVDRLRALAKADTRVKVILNTRNFGHIRSPYYGILQSSGVATLYLASDLQDPPELLPQFIRQWEAGYKIVMAVKPVSKTSRWMHALRRTYYKLLDSISEVPMLKDSTGFGLYDAAVLDQLRRIEDPYPYLRGLICDLGYTIKAIPFDQPRRLRGLSKNNFYTLYDIAMLGVVSHSKVPIRLAAFIGIVLGLLSMLVALVFLILKLLYWRDIPFGFAPILIGMFFLFGVQFFFIGMLGEYIGAIHTYVQKRPIVVEEERINF